MQQELIREIKKRLLEKKAAISSVMDDMEKEGLDFSMKESISELSSYDNHPADVGTEVFERSKDIALLDNEDIILEKIEDALQKIEDGTYGYCSSCGKEIDVERLKALPETTLCKECRLDLEGEAAPNPRPIEEEVLNGYEGLADGMLDSEKTGEEDEIEFDGEDTWQQLTRMSEHAPFSGAGSYYGPMDNDEDRGYTEAVDAIPYFKGADGVYYGDLYGKDDELSPKEVIIGDEGWDKVQNKKKDK